MTTNWHSLAANLADDADRLLKLSPVQLGWFDARLKLRESIDAFDAAMNTEDEKHLEMANEMLQAQREHR